MKSNIKHQPLLLKLSLIFSFVIFLFSGALFALNSSTKTVVAGIDVSGSFIFTLREDGESYSVRVNPLDKPTGSLIIPVSFKSKPITHIEQQGFMNCDEITSISVPSSVQEIGESAFAGCTAVESISLPFVGLKPNLDDDSSDRYFYKLFGSSSSVLNDYDIKQVTISSGKIYNDCFQGLDESLETVHLGAGVTELQDGVFSAFKIKTVTFDQNSQLETIYDSVFANSGLTAITIPASVSEIGMGAFYRCRSLETVVFEENSGVTALWESVFCGCESLTSVTLSEGIEFIDSSAFSCCYNLTSIVIPASLQEIGESAFSYCESLESITFSANSQLQTIGYDAFFLCSSLEKIELPSSVQSISEGALEACGSLREATIPFVGLEANLDDYSSDKYFFKPFVTDQSAYSSDTPNTLHTLKKITVLGGRVYAYSFCDAEFSEWLEEIVLGENVLSIGNGAFQYSSLKSVTILGNPTFDNGPFFECKKIESVKYSTSGDGFTFQNGVLTMLNQELTVAPQLENTINPLVLSVAWQNGGTNIKTIHNSMFSQCYNLKEITIPASIETIGDWAFGSSGVSTFNFMANSSLKTIGYGSFAWCFNLQEIVLPEGLETLGEQSFCNCQNLQHVSIPNSIKQIDVGVFFDCNNLLPSTYEDGIYYLGNETNPYLLAHTINDQKTQVVFHSGCRFIDSDILGYNSNVVSITLPSTVEYICSQAIHNCVNLETIKLNKGLKTIDYYNLANCPKLKVVFIPNTVQNISECFLMFEEFVTEQFSFLLSDVKLESIIINPSVLNSELVLPNYLTWYYGNTSYDVVDSQFGVDYYIELKTQSYQVPQISYYAEDDYSLLATFNSTVMQDYTPQNSILTFDGWYIDSDHTTLAPNEGEIIPAETTKIYAHFNELPIDVDPVVPQNGLSEQTKIIILSASGVGLVAIIGFGIARIIIKANHKQKKKRILNVNLDFLNKLK